MLVSMKAVRAHIDGRLRQECGASSAVAAGNISGFEIPSGRSEIKGDPIGAGHRKSADQQKDRAMEQQGL